MKKLKFIIALAVSLCFTSCEEKKPETTYERDAPSEIQYPNFGIVRKKTKWDANRLCSDGQAFRVTKNAGAEIVSTDVCDHCNHMWYVHEKK
uniref:hypothetical protein n=1 Tax=Candidatus Limisoma sp. TaxID=3076476 RepID=UPI003FEE8D98